MKQTFLQVGKEGMFLELIQNPVYGLNVKLLKVFSIGQDIIQIYNHEDIKLFRLDLIDISLKHGRGIG